MLHVRLILCYSRRLTYLLIYLIIKQNWRQFLLVVDITALKRQISKFYTKILSTDASVQIYGSHWPVTNVKG